MNQPIIEMFTCIAIIIAMVFVVFRVSLYRIFNFLKYINPFNRKRIDYLSERVDQLEMQKYDNENYFIKLKLQVEKLKKHSLKNQNKNVKRNEK